MRRHLGSKILFGLTAGLVLAASLTWVEAQQNRGGQASGVAIDPDDIGGVVTSPKGPEAGVWVVAETSDLPTRFARIVVTDDRGRYLLPDLPRGTYQVFVRGYGLVEHVRIRRGNRARDQLQWRARAAFLAGQGKRECFIGQPITRASRRRSRLALNDPESAVSGRPARCGR